MLGHDLATKSFQKGHVSMYNMQKANTETSGIKIANETNVKFLQIADLFGEIDGVTLVSELAPSDGSPT